MMQEHFFAECSCSGNGTAVGIDHDSGSLHVHIKCILKRLVLFLFTAIDPWGEETWGEENGCRHAQFCSKQCTKL